MSKKLSVFLCHLLRHHPEKAGLEMDKHGWVSVEQLIRGVNRCGKGPLTAELLETLVAQDEKGRYVYNQDHTRIKCCQGHSIPWIEPELVYGEPPQYLYHGTTTAAMKKIDADGYILRMRRHAVHMQPSEDKAWQSANRWHLTPVVLKIDAAAMFADGYRFGMADNAVWCTQTVPVKYICDRIYIPS